MRILSEMATSAYSGGDFDEDPPSTARECATRAIENSDEPVKPAELADEYGCSSGHMRNILRELMDEGEVVRVDRGEYADASAADVESAVEDTGGESAIPDAPTVDEDASPSEPEAMPTDEEYREQHDLDGDESDDQEEEVSDDQDDEKPAIEEEDIADVEAPSGAAGAAAAGAAGLSLLGDRDGVNVWLIVGGVALAVLVYMIVSSDGGGDQSDDGTEESVEEESVEQTTGGGLRGD